VSTTPLNQIPRPTYAEHPAYGKLFRSVSLDERRVALRRFWSEFSHEFQAKWRFDQNKKKAANGKTTPLYEQLKTQGALGLKLTEEEKARTQEMFKPHIERVKAKRAAVPPEKRGFENMVEHINRTTDPEAVEYYWQIFQRLGVLEAAGLYLGKRITWLEGDVQMNDDTDVHLKNHFADIDFADPPTNYMHLDSSIDILKCILYYSEVTEDTGPFCYVIGSNAYKSGIIEYAARKANDKVRLDKTDRASREIFWALPALFQHKAEFGNDLITSTPQASALLAGEHKFTSKDGDLVFFDNNNGVHRGSIFKNGYRIIVQFRLG
jgi:hypothetical protein